MILEVLMIKVNLEEGLSRFDELWRPKIVADLNDYKVQLVKVQGEWVWHKHDETDEFFLVIAGRLTMQMPGGDVELGPGELLVVPKGVEHRPMASEVTHLLLIEPFGTPNTGDVGGERTAPEERL
jgi:mannose-6-phosphate isomerase-like protein (cupin superfamily)